MTAEALLTRYRIEGMDCASCAAKIDTAVRRLDGIEDVAVSVSAGTMAVRHAPAADLVVLERRVSGLGYAVFPLKRDAPAPTAGGHGHDHAHHEHHDHDHPGHDHGHGADAVAPPAPAPASAPAAAPAPWWAGAKARLTIACGAAVALAYGISLLVPSIAEWLFAAAMLVGLVPIARRAVMAALAGTPFSIEMLMTVAAIGALIIGAGEEAAAVVFLFLVGELLEGVAAGRARDSIRALASLVPKTARLIEGGTTREVPAESLAIGATILVRPGERVPADGTVLAGEGGVDEAPVTGESVPVRKTQGDAVFAGTVNGEAALTVRVNAAAADNTIARVVRLVEEAQESKAPTERFIDRFARWYTPAVVVVAALVALAPPLLLGGNWDEWIYKGLALLLIGCPCALVISTPAAIAAALAAGARRGLLIKGGAVLETLGTVNAVAFDKTGTLTEGRPQLTDLIGLERTEPEVLRLAAALEAGSSHPLALAILARAGADGITVPPAADARALGGEGVAARVEGVELFLGSARAAGARAPLEAALEARIAALHDEGKTVSLLVADGRAAGLLALRDQPRPDAAAGLQRLRAQGIRLVMLTGDNRRTAAAIGGTLGIEVRAELMPADKLRIVGELQAEGRTVAKVGDGINDAPALAAANVGIAMGGGTDVALETADAAALHGRVGDVAEMIALSKRTLANIRQNLTIALGLKAVFLVTTIAGITGLWPAILADTGATVLVTANALRLLQAPRA